jgi:hypothetical protein
MSAYPVTAICAICMAVVIEPQRFVVSGTEAMHAECARTGRPTVNQRLQSSLAAAREEIATRDRRAIQQGNRIAELRLQLRSYDRANAERAAQDNRIALLERHLERAQAEIGRLEVDLQLRDVTARLGIGSIPPPPPQTTSTPDGPSEHRDDTEIRFSLLELDTP